MVDVHIKGHINIIMTTILSPFSSVLGLLFCVWDSDLRIVQSNAWKKKKITCVNIDDLRWPPQSYNFADV